MALAVLVVAAFFAIWISNRLGFPSILLLLAVGVTVGPLLGLVDPDAEFGDLLAPAVSLAVGIILFEGGLSLRAPELEGRARPVWLLVTVGVVVTWVVAALIAWQVIGMSAGPAVLLGSILVVSGPTVIGPMLRSIRPTRSSSAVLKWESVLVDPIGAMLAVVTFDVLLVEGGGSVAGDAVLEVTKFIAVGVSVALLVAAFTLFALHRYWVPDDLVSVFGITVALMAFVVADEMVPESGLLATTILGVVVGNRAKIRADRMFHFSESLRVLLIGVLFVVLSARIDLAAFESVGWGTAALLGGLVFVARPVAVALSTFRSSLSLRERAFLVFVAPRGIVAALVASVFALELEAAGFEDVGPLVPIVFVVIAATVMLYGIVAPRAARLLGVAHRLEEGALVLGAGTVEREIAGALDRAGIPVVVATTNRSEEYEARMTGLRTFYGNAIAEDVDLHLELSGIGRLFALTPNDELNTLAVRTLAGHFGEAETYQLAPSRSGPGWEVVPSGISGRRLFGSDVTYAHLERQLRNGRIRATTLTDDYGATEFHADHPSAVALFVVSGDRVTPAVDGEAPIVDRAAPGDIVLWVGDR